MTAPKIQLPGQVVMLTRRTHSRCYFLCPGRESRQLLGYLCLHAAQFSDFEPSAAMMMSNHHHIVGTDRAGRRSEFTQHFHRNVTAFLNLTLSRRDTLWDGARPGDLALLDVEKIIKLIVYTVTNPVRAHLVDQATEWTGFKILPDDWGKPMRFERPAICGTSMPEVVVFTPMPPQALLDHMTLAQAIRRCNAAIAKEEKRLRRYRRRNGIELVGIEACENVSPFSHPESEAPMRQLNPRVGSSSKTRAHEALKHMREFRAHHKAARKAFCAGDRDVVFPEGTLQMRRRAGATVRPASRGHPWLVA